MVFRDREEAGDRLAEALGGLAHDAPVVETNRDALEVLPCVKRLAPSERTTHPAHDRSSGGRRPAPE